MTTLDELERSVERLNRAVKRLTDGMGKYGFANVYNDDVQLLLSERAKLLAAVERLETALIQKADEGMLVLETLAALSPNHAHRHVKEGLAMARQARAALTTGEAGSPIGQNDQPGLAFSDAGEP